MTMLTFLSRNLQYSLPNVLSGKLPRYSTDSVFVLITGCSLKYKDRGVEILCPTCPTWSHFIQDKLEISIYLSRDNKFTILYFIHVFGNIYELTCCVENSVDPDQLAS